MTTTGNVVITRNSLQAAEAGCVHCHSVPVRTDLHLQ